MVRYMLYRALMTTCEWLFAQSILTEQAAEDALTEADRVFWVQRLNELQGRVRFEQRLLAKSVPEVSNWEGDHDLFAK